MGVTFKEFADGDPQGNITVEASQEGGPALSDIIQAAGTKIIVPTGSGQGGPML